MTATVPQRDAGLARVAQLVSRARIGLRRLGRRFASRLVGLRVTGSIAEMLAMFDRRRAFHLSGWLAGIGRRHDDHTEFWRSATLAFPDDANLTRRLVDAALQSGRIGEAEIGFERLLASGAARASDGRFVVGLANADQRRGDIAAIRARIRRFLANLRTREDCRIAAVRLSRLVLAHFPRRSAPVSAPSWFRTRLLSMLERSAVRSAPRNLLLRVARCEAQLESACPPGLFDTDVSSIQRASFVSLVRTRLSERRPFSFIRIGDGDAACLPYEPRLASHAAADAKDRESIWWGAPLRNEVRAQLAPRIARAMWDADCIGIPTTARFLRELRLHENDTLERGLTGRGLRSILYCAERFGELRTPGLPLPVFTSCHLHHELALSNCYAELFEGVKDVVLISCHPDLAGWFESHFKVGVAGNLVLPPDNVSAPRLRRRVAETRVLPEILENVIESLGDLPRGRLVLVGAGYPGKLLVAVAKERGGIALDLGSIFDYWLGLNTRSYLDIIP